VVPASCVEVIEKISFIQRFAIPHPKMERRTPYRRGAEYAEIFF
jgi:hypothetical protein